MAELEEDLPGMVLQNLQEQLKRIDGFEEDIAQVEKQIVSWQKREAARRAISEIPGIGKLRRPHSSRRSAT